MTVAADELAETAATPPQPSRLRTVLVAVIAVAALVVAVAGGYAWGNHSGSSGSGASAVDIGFAQDMSVHHSQAVTMAGYARDYTDDPGVKLLAYDIEDQQSFQIGQMTGWIDSWGAPMVDPSPMKWMAGHDHLTADGLMPGMATPDQVAKLKTLHGKALDIFFLQLMINHHLGGIPMARYAAQNAKEPYVRALAQAVVNAQSSEIVTMNQMLSKLGGTPLPPPAS